MERLRKESHSPFENRFALCSLLRCKRVGSLTLQEQAVFEITTKIILTFCDKALVFLPLMFRNIPALSTASTIGRLLPICYH